MLLAYILLFGCGGHTYDNKNTPIAISQFEKKDLFTKAIIDNETIKGKYTLIDLWGSWCGPCVDGIPDLVEIHQQYGDRLNILSIANDKPKDLPHLKKLIQEKGMSWMHVWENMELPLSERLTGQLNPDYYPTIIVLDPHAREIYRVSGGYFLMSKIKKKLSELNI